MSSDALQSIADRIRTQAECLEGYAEQNGYSGKAPASVFHWQATHFRDLAAEIDKHIARQQPEARATSGAGIPDGWKLVPVDLTYQPAVRQAGWKHVDTKLFHGLEAQMQAMWSAMLAAVPASPTEAPGSEGAGWRTMESAPKDGTAVLLYFSGLAWPGMGELRTHVERHQIGWYSDSRWWEGGTGHDLFESFVPSDQQPTHWMPLPPSPTRLALNEREGG